MTYQWFGGQWLTGYRFQLALKSRQGRMFETPSRGDVQRHLDLNIRHVARHDAAEKRRNVEADAARRGTLQSSMRVQATEKAVDEVHREFAKRAAVALQQFAERGVDPKDLVAWARPHLDLMKDDLISVLQSAPKFESVVNAPPRQVQAIFDQRIDSMLADFLVGIVNGISVHLPGRLTPTLAAHADDYVSEARISKMRGIKGTAYDLGKLVRLCEELNANWHAGSYLAVAALLRMMLDHVPPIFNSRNFDQVIAQAPGKSLKSVFSNLNEFGRDTADFHLHEQIGKRHILPVSQQVDQRSPVDHLLAEIIKRCEPAA